MVLIDVLPTDEGLEDKTAVLMLTCKKFESAWHPFFTLLKKYWPDCPYRVFMGTDVGTYPNVECVQIGLDKGWATNCIEILDKIEAERVILFLEDYFLSGPINNDRIRKLARHSHDYNISCLRLFPCPGPTAPWPETESLGILQKQDKYRLSLQVAMWQKTFLQSLLRKGENAWQVEIEGTKRAARSNGHFVSVLRGEAPISYKIGIRRGVWQKEVLNFLAQQGIKISDT